MHGREQANSGDGDGGGERILGTQDAVEKGRKGIYSATRRSAEWQGRRVWSSVHGVWPQVEARKEGVEKPGQGKRKMCP